jgi:hypothetical protein
MKVEDPFGALHSEDARAAAVRLSLRSDGARYIRMVLGEHLADLEDNDDLELDFTRGYRMALRVAYLTAGGECDGSEEDWARIVEEHRG